MRRIAVMTTGGDASGMNAAIRAVVRTAVSSGLEVYGIEEGYHGLLENKYRKLESSSVGGIINTGGTILQTVRSPEYKSREKRKIAYGHLKDAAIDGMVVIGGDGSRMGAYVTAKETGIPVAFVPGSIDNDVFGTDYTIGFDTAVNVGIEAIDRIRDTAASHERIFIVEVMGREHGFLAMETGLAGGAEVILLPELRSRVDIGKVCARLKDGMRRGKNSSIIVMAEGAGSSAELAPRIEKLTGVETRYSVLGYIQRGGRPTALSRKLGLAFGYEAVMQLMKMKKGQSRMVGLLGNKLTVHNMGNVIGREKKIDIKAYNMNSVFSI
jgi:6-phosphofructokinase 1